MTDNKKNEKNLKMTGTILSENLYVSDINKGQSPRPFLIEWTRLAERKKYDSFSF